MQRLVIMIGLSEGKQNAAKPVLGGVRIVPLSISSHELVLMNRLNETAVF